MESMEKLQLFLEELLQGFNAPEQDIYALILKFFTDLPAEITKFLDLDGLKTVFNAKMGCEV